MFGWSKVRKLSVIAIGTTAGLVYFYQRHRVPQPVAYNSWTNSNKIEVSPCALWDYNWDCREPKSLVRPLKNDTPLEQNRFNLELEGKRPKAARHIVLIRHGEYLDEGDSDDNHMLTDRGRLQAKFTGKRLRDLGIKWDKIITSTMTRAEETAEIMLKSMDIDEDTMKHCDFLREGAPIPPQPPVGRWRPEKAFFQDGARIEAGFRKYFYRASPEQKYDSYTLIVGHGNVIRYFVCRALQLPPECWLRMNINHASITWITISASGHVSIKYLGDTGFMPVNYLTNRIPRKEAKNIV